MATTLGSFSHVSLEEADTQIKKSKAEQRTPSPPLEGGPTNRWRAAAAIFGEGATTSSIEHPASLPLPEFAVALRARQIRPSLKGRASVAFAAREASFPEILQ